MRRALALLLLIGVASCGEGQPAHRARILDADGNVQLELELAIAETEYERREGLRLHGPLAEDEALLLIFPREARVCITNTGVPFPIDVLYISATHHVMATEPNIPPNAPGPYCHPTTRLALELRGDTLRPQNYAKLELF
jgi:uncharacterized membrane protein (UPF0127 family)